MLEKLFKNGSGSLLAAFVQALNQSKDHLLRVPDYKPIVILLHHAFEMLLKVIVGASGEGLLKVRFSFNDILDARKGTLHPPKPNEIIAFYEAARRAAILTSNLATYESFLRRLNHQRNDYYHSFPRAVMDNEPVHWENYEDAEKAIHERDKLVFGEALPVARKLLSTIGGKVSSLGRESAGLLDFGKLKIKGRVVDPLRYVENQVGAGRAREEINGAKRLALAQMYYYPRRRGWVNIAAMTRSINRAVIDAKRKRAHDIVECPVCKAEMFLWAEYEPENGGYHYLTGAECTACPLELESFAQKLFKI